MKIGPAFSDNIHSEKRYFTSKSRFSFEKVKHSCIARSIACPTLVTVVERGGFGAISTDDLYKSAKAVNSNLSLRVFSHLQALTLDAQSPNPTLVNEFVFDWIVDRLRE